MSIVKFGPQDVPSGTISVLVKQYGSDATIVTYDNMLAIAPPELSGGQVTFYAEDLPQYEVVCSNGSYTIHISANQTTSTGLLPGTTPASSALYYEPLVREGLLAARPAASVQTGFYLATDENAGTLYRSTGLAWEQVGAGVSWPSGQILAIAQLAGTVDIKAAGTTIADVAGMSISVPASPARPVLLRFKGEVFGTTGTATAGSLVTGQLFITDSGNTNLASDYYTVVSNGSSYSASGKFVLELYLPAPVSAATYKLRTRTTAAIPANWTTFAIIPGYGALGAGADNFYAVTV